MLILNYFFINTKNKNPSYEFEFSYGKKKLVPRSQYGNITELNEILLLSEKYIHSVKWMLFENKKIKRDSIIINFSDVGPKFYLTDSILFYNEKSYILVKDLSDCYYNEHFRAYYVDDWEMFTRKLLDTHVLNYSIISCINRLEKGIFYFGKHWF